MSEKDYQSDLRASFQSRLANLIRGAWHLLNKPFICVIIGAGIFTGIYRHFDQRSATRQWLIANSKYIVECKFRIDAIKNLFPLESHPLVIKEGFSTQIGNPKPTDMRTIIDGYTCFYGEFKGTKTEAILYELALRFPSFEQIGTTTRADLATLGSIIADRANYKAVPLPEYTPMVPGDEFKTFYPNGDQKKKLDQIADKINACSGVLAQLLTGNH